MGEGNDIWQPQTFQYFVNSSFIPIHCRDLISCVDFGSPDSATSFLFATGRNRLIAYSRRIAAPRSATASLYTSSTGRLVRVYLAPRPALCKGYAGFHILCNAGIKTSISTPNYIDAPSYHIECLFQLCLA